MDDCSWQLLRPCIFECQKCLLRMNLLWEQKRPFDPLGYVDLERHRRKKKCCTVQKSAPCLPPLAGSAVLERL